MRRTYVPGARVTVAAAARAGGKIIKIPTRRNNFSMVSLRETHAAATVGTSRHGKGGKGNEVRAG